MTPAEARRVLGLGPDDHDPDVVRHAYRHAVRRHHPDRPGGDPVRFRRSVLAFELLTVTVEPAATPAVAPVADPVPAPTEPPRERAARLDLLMVGLDRVGEVTYLDRSLALVEGVLPHPGGALQVLLVGNADGSGQVVDVIHLGGGDAPTPGEIHRLLIDAGGPTSTPGA